MDDGNFPFIDTIDEVFSLRCLWPNLLIDAPKERWLDSMADVLV